MPNPRPTIRDVAKHAGVSHQTVSRVINGSPDVTPETRLHVETSIEALGYHPSAIARSMARGQTSTLACLAPNLTDYTFARFIEGAEQEARRQGFFLLSSASPDEESFRSLLHELVGHRRVDGLLVANPYVDQRSHDIPANFPVVLVGAHAREKSISSVCLDDLAAAREATRHLLACGRKRIAMVAGAQVEDCSRDRRLGFEQALHEAGLPIDPALIYYGDWSASSGREALKAFALAGKQPDAVFAQNDRMALGVLRAARELGWAVPEQLAVIGIDDMPLAAHFDPPLTSIHQDMHAIGQEAARLLLEQIQKTDALPQQIAHPFRLVIRESTCR